ncbi:SH3 domain-binding protein 2 isoform X2 [Electrophorus electricus]|uniref:SH3 domain-binding protein 2 isoform X2 n=1 Tax=Electrophorus electricus TaxID=8005 RepID=UPI0015CFA3F6|nr:SH3 domain-binding protein 2 isoform X2 [Electrophorus electricus]
MALLVKKKKSFIHLQETHMKMCLTNQHIINMAAAQISWPIPMRAIGAQNLLTMPGGVTIAGYLHKKGGSQFSLMKWPLRYIIIHRGCVYYFKTSSSATPQGAFSLKGYNRVMRAAEETTSSNVFPFKIVHFSKRHRTWYFSSASEDERRKWMRLLRKEIDHYNNEKDLLVLSESDSDSESFYGQIESPLDITDAPDHPEAEYRLQDEDSDEEDYLLPDGPGHSKVPPPNYPPPPVPSHDRDHSVPNHPKGPPPPVPPLPNKTPPCPIRKKPSPLFPGPPIHLEIVAKGPPPPLPISVHTTQKSLFNRINGGLASPTPPAPSAACLKKLTVPPIATLPAYNRKLSPPVIIKSPSTLPICQDLENKVVLNNRDKFGLFNSHNHIPGTKSAEERKSNLPTSGGQKALLVPKPPLPGAKLKVSQPSLQSSPDGQSFRSSVEENPLKLKVKSKTNDENSDDSDYENVELPDCVFVDTTETCAVEKLFKETARSPQDGLYCIRNSGTKTSKVLVVWDISLNKARNYRVFEENSNFYLDAEIPPFSSLAALVEYYCRHPLPNHGSLCLQHPYGYTSPR